MVNYDQNNDDGKKSGEPRALGTPDGRKVEKSFFSGSLSIQQVNQIDREQASVDAKKGLAACDTYPTDTKVYSD